MSLWLIPIILLFLGVIAFLPGFAVTRHWHLSPADTFVVAPAVSFGMLYFGGFLIYTTGLPLWSFYALTALLLLGSAPAWPAFLRCLRNEEVRPLGWAVALTALWLVGWQMLPRCYSGGPWYWDWLEHFYRSRLFAEHGSVQSAWGPYLLPARPPLVNVVLGVILAHFGSHMPVYQTAYAALSALAILPVARFALHWGVGRAALWGGVLLVALNPMFVQNGTFSWTRGPTSYLILLTLWLYASIRREPLRSERMALMVGVGALALLAHYSAGPYLVVLGGDLLIRLVRERFAGMKAVALGAVVGITLLLPWFLWCFAVFGWQTTVGNNSSVTTISGLSVVGYLTIVAGNIVDSVAPTILLPQCLELLDQKPLAGLICDRLFVMYQMNLWAALTLTNLLALYYLFFLRPRKERPAPGPDRSFWLTFAGLVAVLGIAVHGPKTERWGLTAVCLQPLIFLTLAWLGSVMGNARAALKAAWLGAAVVESVGMTALHFYMQRRVLTEVGRTAAGLIEFDPAAGASGYTQSNWRLKLSNGITFLGDSLGSGSAMAVWIALAVVLAVLVATCWLAGQTSTRQSPPAAD